MWAKYYNNLTILGLSHLGHFSMSLSHMCTLALVNSWAISLQGVKNENICEVQVSQQWIMHQKLQTVGLK